MGSAGKRHQRHAMTCGEAFRRSEPYIIGAVVIGAVVVGKIAVVEGVTDRMDAPPGLSS